jgi:TolB-like protein/tetratricopeptide (TPR) repeat protein
MHHAGLHRPRPEALQIDALLNGNRHVLMPRNFPVSVGHLIEENSTHWKETIAKNGLHERPKFWRLSKTRDLRNSIQQIPDGENSAATMQDRIGARNFVDRTDKRTDSVAIQHILNSREPFRIESFLEIFPHGHVSHSRFPSRRALHQPPCYNHHAPFLTLLNMAVYRFGEFQLDEQTLQLLRGSAPVRIQQQPARVLAFLLGHRGSLVTREQIRLAIWGDETFVDFEQGLNFCIRQIRIALNDQAENPRYVETLPRLGYRFVAPIEKTGAAAPAPEKRHTRIAIAPFDDFASQAGDYFAAGLTEDMVSALSRIDSARLRVTSVGRLAADATADELSQLQRQFDLDYVLRGSVRRSADKVRITAQLHDLRDKSILWSDTYDRKSADLLAVQEEVTRRVSHSLALELFPSATVGARRYARSSAAYDAYLKGRFFWHKMTPEGIGRSIAYFNEALALDSAFAPALAGLADCYAQLGSVRVGEMKPLDALAKAHSCLKRALDLDETLAEAHCTLGLIKSWYDWDWDGAEREFQIALALDPSQITALLWQSLLLGALGRHAEAIASVQRAREFEPLSVAVNVYLGVAQTHAGQYDLATRQFQHAIELDPAYYRTYMFLGRALTMLQRYDEAIAALERGLALNPDSFETAAFLAEACGAKGDRDRCFAVLDQVKAVEARTEPAILIAVVYGWLGLDDEFFAGEFFTWLDRAVAVKSTPIYIPLLCNELSALFPDPRFQQFLDRINLPRGTRG